MCGNGLFRMLRMARQETTAATPATTPIAHLDLEAKTSAEVPGEHLVPRAPTADAA
jgi:hypothetical protein